MTRKQILLVFLLAALLAAGIRPVTAQGITSIYVDTSRTTGNEDGSQTNPYNSEKEGKAYLQALPYGGDLYVRNRATDPWSKATPVAPSTPGVSGEPLPPLTLYILLGILGLLFMLGGWWLSRRGQALGA